MAKFATGKERTKTETVAKYTCFNCKAIITKHRLSNTAAPVRLVLHCYKCHITSKAILKGERTIEQVEAEIAAATPTF